MTERNCVLDATGTPQRQGTIRATLSHQVGVLIYGVPEMAHAGHANRWDDPASITLRAGLCDLLEDALFAVNRRPLIGAALANALFVLAHELGHVLVPTNDEWRADEYAVAHFKLLARQLGLSRWQARRLWRVCPYR